MDTTGIKKQIKDIEDEIFNTQKNKATEHHIGKLKAKLARLREELEKRKSSGGKGKGFEIKKQGDATVALIGFPSIGKSTLLNKLTAAESEVGSYDFTTLDAIPGMMKYKGALIQIFDLPGLIKGASKGRGRGKEIISAVRNADLVLFMIDAQHRDHLDLMAAELYEDGLRLNENRPDVVINKKGQGGITVASPISLSHLDKKLIKDIASEYVTNADIVIREDITEDQLIDVFIGNRSYIPALVLINKIDLISKDDLSNRMKYISDSGWDVISVSALENIGIDKLKEKIFSKLKLIRIYMKPVGKAPDLNEPLILKKNSTIEDACKKIHRDFKKKFRYATVSGPSAKHDSQKAGLDHILKDEDILTIVVDK
jgi:hypothetical protein